MKSFSELTGKEKAVELLRWILVPPAAGLAVFALQFVARFVWPPAYAQLPGTAAMPVSDFHRFILPRIFGMLMAAAFVIAGAKMAPRSRLVAAIALAILWTGYCFMNHVLVHLGRGTPHYLDFALAIAAAAGGVAYIFYSEKSKARPQ